MARQLASIRRISDIRPIAGADRIVVAQVDGWECVVQKDEFHVGDRVVYIEVDSVVPERPEFEFLRDRKFRVRTIKLRVRCHRVWFSRFRFFQQEITRTARMSRMFLA